MNPVLPLAGLHVLDLTRVLAGPYCTMVLADLGAEVIKLEVPGRGDDSRHFGPFVGSESAYFMSLNRNKRSITLDLKTARGKELFLELLPQFDVLVENYRGGAMEKLGLGYGRLQEVHPRLIYAAVSGFGHTGPYREKPAYDVVVQGMGGLMSITGQPDGPPTRVGASMGDITAGLFTVIGILAALRKRELTGVGDKVDVSMLDSQVAILENAIARYQVTGEPPRRIGNRHPSITPFTSLPTTDGYVIVAIGNDKLWEVFCRLVDREELIGDGRFRTNQDRTENWEALEPILVEIFAAKGTQQWLAVLEPAGIPCGPINTVDQVLADPQVRARGMVVAMQHPVAGRLEMAGSPVKLANSEPPAPHPSPLLGQHTEEVLREFLGLDDGQIAALRDGGVV
ncbi:MAG TPA: CaiB/BaiF CoA-transferase family protein [Deferrisomatales bacterium]|nr:CaiB/BaiF CoA-transferase family protein [Deferrisomatales bacterium]